MKKFFAVLAACVFFAGVWATAPAAAEEMRIMASFYPIYILAMPVFEGVEGVALDCMTAPETGCLHDYQLLVSDMMKLSEAEALIVCGAGMENYLPDVSKQFPNLTVIDCSQGIDLLPEDVHHQEEADEAEEYNAHTWLDAQNAIRIVKTIAEGAGTLFPEKAEQLNANAEAYIARLEALDAEIREQLLPVAGGKIVTFHEAFPYFARAYGLEIAAVISEEHEDTLSPAQLTAVIETVREAGNPPLFTEPQYSDAAAFAVAAETGAQIYELDPLASGEISPDAYEQGMRRNARAILNAFGQE